jgi:hypothetical protein
MAPFLHANDGSTHGPDLIHDECRVESDTYVLPRHPPDRLSEIPMSLTVIEVLDRSKEGRTQPYICRCDDGEVYFVKGRSATRTGLAAEWIGAQLAMSLGLPIAPYAIADVPVELIEADLSGWLQELGPGAVFASQRVEAVNLTTTHIDLVSHLQRQDVLLFDWWIHNGDRNLTAMGGNCNLLWKPSDDDGLVLIDHNLAFDPEFSPAEFLELHVFANEATNLFSDFVLRQQYQARIEEALKKWAETCDNLPKAWSFVDSEETIPVDLRVAEIKRFLDRALTDAFWQLPR